MFGVGSIEGAILSFAARPFETLAPRSRHRHQGHRPRLRLGAVALPFANWPTISLSGRHFFGDINGLVRVLSTGGYTHDPRLEHLRLIAERAR